MDEEQQMQEAVRQDQAPNTMDFVLTSDQIVVDRQALLDIVRALDIGAELARLPKALDALREPFFMDEISTGKARKDFTRNTYA